jgi:hypothetical protein
MAMKGAVDRPDIQAGALARQLESELGDPTDTADSDYRNCNQHPRVRADSRELE